MPPKPREVNQAITKNAIPSRIAIPEDTIKAAEIKPACFLPKEKALLMRIVPRPSCPDNPMRLVMETVAAVSPAVSREKKRAAIHQ
ncbi:MAG: hypothetical protein WBQ49_14690 [Rhodomicrobium sp.]